MDPTISIDLSSVAGIVALTLMLVHYLKAPIGRIPFLREFPLQLYVVLTSGGLTWLAHDVLHTLEGNKGALITQAIVSALAASGAVEWWRAGVQKGVADTTAAKRSVERSQARLYLVPLLLAIGLSAGACASSGRVLVEIDRGIFASVATVDNIGNAACDAQLRPQADCKTFNAALAGAYDSYQQFNRCVKDRSLACASAMVAAIDGLHSSAITVAPEAIRALDDLKRLAAQLRAMGEGK